MKNQSKKEKGLYQKSFARNYIDINHSYVTSAYYFSIKYYKVFSLLLKYKKNGKNFSVIFIIN
ncbi:hypothetical protein CN476_13185 [Bacillus cereus]|nr:hypothetical protein CN476_13185 [Bacillus cereus]